MQDAKDVAMNNSHSGSAVPVRTEWRRLPPPSCSPEEECMVQLSRLPRSTMHFRKNEIISCAQNPNIIRGVAETEAHPQVAGGLAKRSDSAAH